jgi:hypothetical protein
MPLITSADYDFIRKRIEVSLNEQSLPPSVIESYLSEAEVWVAARVTDLDDLEGSEVAADIARLAHAKRAALYYCASLIAASWSPISSESIGGAGSSWSKKVIDPLANAARLLAMAEGELEEATPEIETGTRTGHGGRAVSQVYW